MYDSFYGTGRNYWPAFRQHSTVLVLVKRHNGQLDIIAMDLFCDLAVEACSTIDFKRHTIE